MNSNKLTSVTGRGVPVRGNDIDTDRIIPARYLKEITFSKMGEYPFYDERFDDKGEKRDHPFNTEAYQKAAILVVNENFGCGSSREHAPQALMRWGIRAIVGISFAEIFFGNCIMLGIPALTGSPDTIDSLQQIIEEEPETRFTVDIAESILSWDEGSAKLHISDGAKSSLLNGTWDSTSLLLSNLERTREVVSGLPYIGWG